MSTNDRRSYHWPEILPDNKSVLAAVAQGAIMDVKEPTVAPHGIKQLFLGDPDGFASVANAESRLAASNAARMRPESRPENGDIVYDLDVPVVR